MVPPKRYCTLIREVVSCFEANEILNLIKDNFTNVTIKVGALAASAATYFLTQFTASAKSNSQFMIHKPMMYLGGNEDEIESNLKLLKNLTADYKKAYSKKMNLTEAEVEQLWVKGDFWMTAKEAKEKGLIDEIENEEEQIDASTRLQLVACGAPFVPKAKNIKTEIKRMDLSVLAVKLGLPATATQHEVDTKLEALQTKAAAHDGLVKAASDKEKADKAAKVKALLDSAEQDKKIVAAQRPHLETMNVEALTAFLDMQTPVNALSDGILGGSPDASKAKWTYAEYQENDPEAFDKLPEAKQKELIDAHYKE